jgi:hypothetical protein
LLQPLHELHLEPIGAVVSNGLVVELLVEVGVDLVVEVGVELVVEAGVELVVFAGVVFAVMCAPKNETIDFHQFDIQYDIVFPQPESSLSCAVCD